MSTIISYTSFPAFTCYLQNEERSAGTVENYLRALRAFVSWQAGAPVDKAAISRWKEYLLEAGYAPVTINAMLAAIHSYLHFRGWDQFRVHYLRVQRRLFRDEGRALSRGEYIRLVRNAYGSGQQQLGLIIETLGGTGIRVSELSAITVEAIAQGQADIHLKGKIRTILIPDKLRRKLQDYARAKKNHQRSNLCHRWWKNSVALQNLGRHEEAGKMQRRSAGKSLSPQPAPSFCH